MSPQWAKNAIWWSVYPLGACGAPIRTPDTPGVHHRLPRLDRWLDHLISLGCNGMALGPIWASSTHGYDVVDHLRIDPRLGDMDDFTHLVEACHLRGIHVLLDGVFNHVSVDHDEVRNPEARIFRRDPARPDGLSRFEGHEGLVELDHSHPEVADYVVTIMNYWLDRGADGWRLDAAYRVPRPFWATVLPRVRASHPEALIVAEVLHGDYARIADQTGFDSITQYELWKAIWSGLKDANPHELMWALTRHEPTLGHEIPWTFVSNHDVTRISTQVGPHRAMVATAILITVAGMPAIYYGDELGWAGLKEERVGGDDEIRPVLPDRPPSLTSLTPEAAETLRQTQLAIRVRRIHPWLVEAHTTVLDCTHNHLAWRSSHGEDWIQADLSFTPEPCLRITDATGELLQI